LTGTEQPDPSTDLHALGFELEGGDDSWFDELRSSAEIPELGRIGSYELLEEVQRGGQGVVFLARQPGTERLVAIKRLLAGSLAGKQEQRRFAREVEAAAALNHPNIVTVYAVEETDGVPVLAMEWVDGVPLTSWRPEGGQVRGRLEVFLRVCDAVSHAHAHGILHRDLKPSNILVDDSGNPHVLDFGLAKRFETDQTQVDLTVGGGFVGTPAYASPEQLRGSLKLDARSDIFSLGLLLHEVLLGGSPYGRERSCMEVMRRLEGGAPLVPRQIPGLDQELSKVVQKCLAIDPEDRYLSVDALSNDLRRYLAGEPVHALPPSALILIRHLLKRNPLATTLSATLLVVVAASAVFGMWQANRYADQRDIAVELNKDLKEAVVQAELAQEAALASQERAEINATQFKSLLQYNPDCKLRAADLNPDYVRAKPE
jgi:serine/threonine protein kinase